MDHVHGSRSDTRVCVPRAWPPGRTCAGGRVGLPEEPVLHLHTGDLGRPLQGIAGVALEGDGVPGLFAVPAPAPVLGDPGVVAGRGRGNCRELKAHLNIDVDLPADLQHRLSRGSVLPHPSSLSIPTSSPPHKKCLSLCSEHLPLQLGKALGTSNFKSSAQGAALM